jgi:hypothetical protein
MGFVDSAEKLGFVSGSPFPAVGGLEVRLLRLEPKLQQRESLKPPALAQHAHA